ncbi:hypothetical protein CI109_107238 [Kwoniella shandongensis]|uniref:Uncharacterized protein n=1 Tax=Kwoniella shandongensis TaxID=1734106 RepID=A0A5M6C3D2_9TREE|nr:uncharacterized protein CI109_002521 [Kwoniella shandongensis]KAA5529180.1 hypothetical protein CI109_002521 [Kwoniella shandongensis]
MSYESLLITPRRIVRPSAPVPPSTSPSITVYSILTGPHQLHTRSLHDSTPLSARYTPPALLPTYERDRRAYISHFDESPTPPTTWVLVEPPDVEDRLTIDLW